MNFRKQLKPQTTINLIPMIDVVFQLVIFFLVSTTFKVVPAINLELPTSGIAEPVKYTSIVIAITDQEKIYLNEEQTALYQVKADIRDKTGLDENGLVVPSIIIEGDMSISYKIIVEVLDVLKSLEITTISLRTKNSVQDYYKEVD